MDLIIVSAKYGKEFRYPMIKNIFGIQETMVYHEDIVGVILSGSTRRRINGKRRKMCQFRTYLNIVLLQNILS